MFFYKWPINLGCFTNETLLLGQVIFLQVAFYKFYCFYNYNIVFRSRRRGLRGRLVPGRATSCIRRQGQSPPAVEKIIFENFQKIKLFLTEAVYFSFCSRRFIFI